MPHIEVEITREFVVSVLRAYVDKSVGGSAVLGLVADALSSVAANSAKGTARPFEDARHMVSHAARIRDLATVLRYDYDQYYSETACTERDLSNKP